MDTGNSAGNSKPHLHQGPLPPPPVSLFQADGVSGPSSGLCPLHFKRGEPALWAGQGKKGPKHLLTVLVGLWPLEQTPSLPGSSWAPHSLTKDPVFSPSLIKQALPS